MMPLNDTEPNRYSFFPIMTITLIVINCLVYYLELFFMKGDGWDFGN